jgi:hypothetical protein
VTPTPTFIAALQAMASEWAGGSDPMSGQEAALRGVMTGNADFAFHAAKVRSLAGMKREAKAAVAFLSGVASSQSISVFLANAVKPLFDAQIDRIVGLAQAEIDGHATAAGTGTSASPAAPPDPRVQASVATITAKMKELKDASTVEVKNVVLKLYNKSGDAYNLVKSAAATLNKAEQRFFSDGEVEITLALPVKGDPKRPPIQIKSSGVSFDTATGQAQTDRATSFSFENGNKLETPRSESRVDDCVVVQIGALFRVAADLQQSLHDRARALKFLVHLVGDMHQPLHAGEWNGDMGGNLRPVFFFDDKDPSYGPLNLHSIWDDNILAKNLRDGGYVLFNLSSSAIAMMIMLPTTFCAGMTLPLITYILIREGHGERSIGAVYAANTVGAIIGVFFAIHLGMPSLGLKGLITFGACLDETDGILCVRWRLFD